MYTYNGINFPIQFFLPKIRWFPDKLIVLFSEVIIDLYMVIVSYCFFRNALTLLCVRLPLAETRRCETSNLRILQKLFIISQFMIISLGLDRKF